MLNLNRQVNIARCQAVENSPLGQLTYESRIRDRRDLNTPCGGLNDVQIVQSSKCFVMDVMEQTYDHGNVVRDWLMRDRDIHAANSCKRCSSDDAGIDLTEGYLTIVKR